MKVHGDNYLSYPILKNASRSISFKSLTRLPVVVYRAACVVFWVDDDVYCRVVADVSIDWGRRRWWGIFTWLSLCRWLFWRCLAGRSRVFFDKRKMSGIFRGAIWNQAIELSSRPPRRVSRWWVVDQFELSRVLAPIYFVRFVVFRTFSSYNPTIRNHEPKRNNAKRNSN